LNFAGDTLASIVGGCNNLAGTGPQNKSYGCLGGESILGGFLNQATSLQSTVSGGRENTASGYVSAVSGGESNTASDGGASVLGGYQNTANASCQSIPATSTC
jgi:hypothetical protein